MPCYSYGGADDPCTLTITNDRPNAGFDKNPLNCTGNIFFLWDEPDTHGRSYAWAAEAWRSYSQAWAEELDTLRERGVRVTTPLLKADQVAQNLEEFWAVCGDECNNRSSPAYIDIVAANPFCGFWSQGCTNETDCWTRDEPSGAQAAEGCRKGARSVVRDLFNSLRGRPVMMTNWGYLGTSTTESQVAAIEATDAFFEPLVINGRSIYSPVERVYYFGATDCCGDTTRNFLTDTVLAGARAGATLGELWHERCESL